MADSLVPPDCVPTTAHLRLLILEQRDLAKLLPLSVEVTGVPAVDHIIIVVDLYGQLGQIVGDVIVGGPIVQHCLRKATERGLPPSFGIPWPLLELIPLVRMCGRDFLEAVVARPAGTMAIAIFDEFCNPGLLLVPPGTFLEGANS